MKTEKKTPQKIDAYIALFSPNIQLILNELRSVIKKIAPDAEEVISYQMPAFKYYGILVYFAAHTNHIGFYPKVSGIETFKTDLSAFKCSKGTIQFPYDKPLPIEVITKIVKFRVAENLEHNTTKLKKKIKKTA